MATTGTFGGHVLPGTFFIIYSLWWLFHACRSHILKRDKHDNDRRSSSRCGRCANMVFCRKALLLEGTIKVLACAIGVVVEGTSAEWKLRDEHGELHGQNDWHHVTMYIFFALSGVVDILSETCVKTVPGRNKLYLSLAFAVEGFLFYLHGHGRHPLDVMLHFLLVLAIFGAAVSTFIEMWFPGETFLSFFRVAFTLLQGTWFYQISFVLFDPRPGAEPWDEDNMLNSTFITMIFTWHVALIIVFINVVYAAMSMYYKCRHGNNTYTTRGNDVELTLEKNGLLEDEFES
ncbi:transmembrane protein 45B-like [Saccoglossus kowalevskii]|uniref:Transmembrane protein 45B-like n=1 Tax=Saccoglossus kowalevskii TaxID=10224 RepID=A0ABM0M8X9_SACKO|nr:PREDICTED: transmembrane protein 45B-like [Saccoglossus kowalevskii]